MTTVSAGDLEGATNHAVRDGRSPRNPGPWGRRGKGPWLRAVVTADQLHAGFQRCPRERVPLGSFLLAAPPTARARFAGVSVMAGFSWFSRCKQRWNRGAASVGHPLHKRRHLQRAFAF